MLIRSQNRIALTNIDNVGTIYIGGYHKDGENYHRSYADNDNTWIVRTGDFSLGEYSSEEKAIKVLDMIQEQYARFSCRYGSDCSDDAVYVMPQDSEVEV